MGDAVLKVDQKEDRLFDILHLSYREKWASGKKFAEKLNLEGETDEFPDWNYYICNIVFRARGELKHLCMMECEKWKEIRVCIDTEKYDEYLQGVEHDFVEIEGSSYNGEPLYSWETINNTGIDRDSLFVTGYTDNFSSFLSYNEKFDVFRFHEYLQYNPATTGILQFIEELKEGKKSYGICCDYNQFYSCLKSLEFFWD
jgi:hypothetical protein